MADAKERIEETGIEMGEGSVFVMVSFDISNEGSSPLRMLLSTVFIPVMTPCRTCRFQKHFSTIFDYSASFFLFSFEWPACVHGIFPTSNQRCAASPT